MRRTLALLLAAITTAAGLATLTAHPAHASDRDCGDFPSQAAAQQFFLAAGAGDPHRLDSDGDGVACESNPCPCVGRGNPATPIRPVTPAPPPIHRETGNVTRVVDGDTLHVRLRRGGIVSVRMLGINTPENGQCGFRDAADNLRRMAPVGSTVHLVSDRTQAATDRYGRLLRYVARQGGFHDLSFRQGFDGYTKPYVYGGKPVARHRELVRGIDAANTRRRGLWGSCWS